MYLVLGLAGSHISLQRIRMNGSLHGKDRVALVRQRTYEKFTNFRHQGLAGQMGSGMSFAVAIRSATLNSKKLNKGHTDEGSPGARDHCMEAQGFMEKSRLASAIQDENSDRMELKYRIDFLWKILGRYDSYVGTTNAKAAILVAYNTFAIGGIIIRFGDALKVFDGHPRAAGLAAALLLMMALSSMVSLLATVITIGPNLRSPKSPCKYHSLIFFGQVAEFSKHEEYVSEVSQADVGRLQQDLATQIHSVAQITRGKFMSLKIATWAAIFQIVLLGLIILDKVVLVIPEVKP